MRRREFARLSRRGEDRSGKRDSWHQIMASWQGRHLSFNTGTASVAGAEAGARKGAGDERAAERNLRADCKMP